MNAEYWVWLQQVLGPASDVVHNIVNEYGDAKSFYLADDNEKIKRCRLTKVQIERLHKVSRKTVYNILKACKENNIRIVTPLCEEYPERLWMIADPPCVLYIKGKPLNINDKPTIAIVGPRKISEYGFKCAEVIADTLASCGFVVVSGGALGGDSAAHSGAVKSGGFTVAVLGGGILSGYLKSNDELRNTVTENGCLLSEDPPFKKVEKGTFPRRNRIMSGISNGVVVIEGSAKSGTLITARHAAEQGRDVFCIPGSPSLPQYEGSNRLLADGAKPLLDINGIISEYLYMYPKAIHKPKTKVLLPIFEYFTSSKIVKKTAVEPKQKIAANNSEKLDNNGLSNDAKFILTVVSEQNFEPFYADEIIDKSQMDAGKVLASLTELEIFGFVESLPGGLYRKH